MTSELPGIRYDGFHRANTATLSIARKCSENQIVGFLSLCFIRSCCTYIFPQIDLKKKKKKSTWSVSCNPSVEGWSGYFSPNWENRR